MYGYKTSGIAYLLPMTTCAAVRYIEITEERRLADERDKLNEEKMKRQKEEEEKKKDEEKDTEENTPGGMHQQYFSQSKWIKYLELFNLSLFVVL